ncbi:MAG: hypothetical protein ABJ205_04475 [Erythrobacter sp.]
MYLLTILALLYVASVAFYHAGKKRSGVDRVRASQAAQRAVFAIAWIPVIAALALIVLHRGWEVGVFLWLGAWIAAALLSVFLAGLWRRAHLPSGVIGIGIATFGLIAFPWGGSS